MSDQEAYKNPDTDPETINKMRAKAQSGYLGKDLAFMAESAEAIIKCRQIIAWSYVTEYFKEMKDTKKMFT